MPLGGWAQAVGLGWPPVTDGPKMSKYISVEASKARRMRAGKINNSVISDEFFPLISTPPPILLPLLFLPTPVPDFSLPLPLFLNLSSYFDLCLQPFHEADVP